MRKFALLLLIGLFFTRVALAQTAATISPTPVITEELTEEAAPTNPPTPALTVEGSGEVLFPEAIRFMLLLSRPASDIRNVRLTIDTETGQPFSPDFELDQIIQIAEPQAFLAYHWLLPDDAVPPLFSTVEFTWEVEVVDGETARLEGIVEFKDQRVVWVTNHEVADHLTLITGRDVPMGLTHNLAMVYELLSENTSRSPVLRYLVYDSGVAPGCAHRTLASGVEETLAVGVFSGTLLPCRPEFAERVYEESGYAVFQRVPGYDVETIMVEHMVRAFYAPLWDGNDVPIWFETGLGLFYAPALKTDLLSIVQAMARNNRLFSLEAMNNTPSDDAELWRAQSYGMVLYIAELAGVQGVFELANAVDDSVSFSEIYEQVTGQSLVALIPAWQGWIFTRMAELVYGITPYQPPTPTRTPTLTDTRTRTATTTPTPTQTYTPSVTGVLSSTPYPTLTSSRTPTREPATVTPRPPVRTPTPTPTNSISILRTPGVQAGVVIVLLIVIGILVYAYVRLGRR